MLSVGVRDGGNHKVVGFDQRNGRIEAVRLMDRRQGSEVRVHAAWVQVADKVAALGWLARPPAVAAPG